MSMERSWLVQRLEKPHSGFAGMTDNPFSFGGGLKNGGLSDEAMDMIRGIFSFDYMGAAEFEFGEVPRALQRIAKYAESNELFAGEIVIDLDTVPENWQQKHERERSGKPKPTGLGTVPIYVLCKYDHMVEVSKRIQTWAYTHKEYEHLKEPTNLAYTLRPYYEWDGRTQGWLELNNGFMFFTDKEMWEKTCNLFGVSTE